MTESLVTFRNVKKHFGNFVAVGIQIGGIGTLAPERRDDLARIGLRAMLGGTLVTMMTATIAGVLL